MQACPKCDGQGGINAHGYPCRLEDVGLVVKCPVCEGECVFDPKKYRYRACPHCRGMGGLNKWGHNCELTDRDFLMDCPVCDGACYFEEVIENVSPKITPREPSPTFCTDVVDEVPDGNLNGGDYERDGCEEGMEQEAQCAMDSEFVSFLAVEGEGKQRLVSESPFKKGPPFLVKDEGKNVALRDLDVENSPETIAGDARRNRGLPVSKPILGSSGHVPDTIEELQWKVSKASDALSQFLKNHEDDGGALKVPACTKARRELERMLRSARDLIRSGRAKKSSTLKHVFQDAKALLEEVVLRLCMYEASLGMQKAVYETKIARDDHSKLAARRTLITQMKRLDRLFVFAPRRFHAAQRDLTHAQESLKTLDQEWKADLENRAKSRPYWVPDNSAPKCAHCQKPFKLLRSRHHCRACGMVFCDACSAWTLPLPTLAYFSEQRVCEMCYREHVAYSMIEGEDGSGSSSIYNKDWSQVAHDIVQVLPKVKSILLAR